jgi:hypothetical protein
MTKQRTISTQRWTQLALLLALAGGTAIAGFSARATRPLGPETTHAVSSQATPIHSEKRPHIEVAFVLDTTGSMSGLLEGAKQKIWSIANQLATAQPAPEIRIGLLAYRDRGDDYVTRVFDLTDDIDSIYGHLRQLQADGGGDTPESVNRALHDAVTKLSWSPGSDHYKVIFLVGDAPPHLDYADDVPYAQSVAAARDAHIALNTIQCGAMVATTPVWREIAQLGHGQFAAIAQDGAMASLETPLDEELAGLSRRLAETVVAYGSAERKAEFRAKRLGVREASAPVAASRLSYLSKKGGKVVSGRSDLVDAVTAGETNLDFLDTAALPVEMQRMAPAERHDYVKEKAQERADLKQSIDELSAKRDAYVEAELERRESDGRGDGFDDQVRRTIREQAAKTGLRWK